MMTTAISCCNTDTRHASREVQICLTEFMIQVRYLKIFLNCREEKILKKKKYFAALATSTHVQQFAAQENPDRS